MKRLIRDPRHSLQLLWSLLFGFLIFSFTACASLSDGGMTRKERREVTMSRSSALEASDGSTSYHFEDDNVGDEAEVDFTPMKELAPTSETTPSKSEVGTDPTPLPPTQATPAASPKPTPQPSKPAPATKLHRKIIYTARLHFAVHDIALALRTAESFAQNYGGWVDHLGDDAIVLRIPSAHLQEVMSAAMSLGHLLSKRYKAQDVTEEFTDLETRIQVLQRTRDQLLALLNKAETVKDALAVRKRLDEITLELEQALGRLRLLSQMVAFSKLTIHLQQQSPIHPHNDAPNPFPWVDMLGVESTEWRKN